MNTAPISFKGLNYDYVSIYDREFYVKKELKMLEELGKKYDIRLTSSYADIPGFSAIDISVKPLKEGLNFFKRLFRPTGKAVYNIPNSSTSELQSHTLVESVEMAINDLGKIMAQRK